MGTGIILTSVFFQNAYIFSMEHHTDWVNDIVLCCGGRTCTSCLFEYDVDQLLVCCLDRVLASVYSVSVGFWHQFTLYRLGFGISLLCIGWVLASVYSVSVGYVVV